MLARNLPAMGDRTGAALERPAPAIGLSIPSATLRARAGDALARDGLAGSAADVEIDAVLARRGTAPDLLVLGPEPEGRPLVETVRALRDVMGDGAIVAIGHGRDRRMLRTALRARVDGFVYEAALEEALAPTVRAVLVKQVVVPREERRQLAPALSHRERQVLALVATGAANATIATRLFLSESTVKSHLTSAFAKLGVSGRTEAADLILDPDEPVGRSVLATLDQDGLAELGSAPAG